MAGTCPGPRQPIPLGWPNPPFGGLPGGSPALASRLNASPAQVELLFTSYLVVTALAMLITGWVSSRIGAKRTLITGLALIVTFAALAGADGQPVPRPVTGPGGQAGQSATVTSVPLTVTTAAGVDASRHRV